MNILETDRLILRELIVDDSPFILELLNDPSFLKYIGDKGVRSDADARQYILNGPVESYKSNGYGLYLVKLKADGKAIGICGLVKRPALPDADIGFAFLPAYREQGYAYEAAVAVLNYGRAKLGLKRVLGITVPDNSSSMKLLRKLGMRSDRMLRVMEDEPEVMLFTTDAELSVE